jgi:hypothetical protein
MTQTHNESGSSKSANAHSPIDWLVRESKRYKNHQDFAAFLVSQIRALSHSARDLEYTVGALRTALGEYLQDQTGETTGNRCHFCGKSRADVLVLLVSAESAICDECVVTGLETISRKQRYLHLRIAFFIFEVVASVGYYISSMFGSIASVGYRLIHRENRD